MGNKEALYKILKMSLNYDISFIIEDLLPNFSVPVIPSNIDFSHISFDLETPFGSASIFTKDIDGLTLYIEHIISDNYAEIYQLNLDSDSHNFMTVTGATAEIRDKGIVINNIEKDYTYHLEDDVIAPYDISRIGKFLEVYNHKEISLSQHNTAKKIANAYLDGIISSPLRYVNSLVIIAQGSLSITIYGHDLTWLYQHCMRNTTYQKQYIVRRIFNLYQGIINQENYEDAQILIKYLAFPMGFAFEDYNNKEKSINNIIEDIAGSSIVSPHPSYTNLVREIVQKYCQSVKSNPFLFDEYSSAENDKKRELKKNNYIQEIILNNRDIM